MSLAFVRGAKVTKAVEQLSEFQVFCATENYWALLMTYLQPSRRIEKAFFRVPLQVHEREFIKAAGSLSLPLTGLAIKQYLTYLLVEHSHAVDLYSCREFCRFFKRTLDDETHIRYRSPLPLLCFLSLFPSCPSIIDALVGTHTHPHLCLMQRHCDLDQGAQLRHKHQ